MKLCWVEVQLIEIELLCLSWFPETVQQIRYTGILVVTECMKIVLQTFIRSLWRLIFLLDVC